MKTKVLVAAGLVVLVAAGIWFFNHGSNSPRNAASIASAPGPSPSPEPSSAPTPSPNPETGDFSAALSRALQETDPRKRSMEFGRLLTQWWERNPEEALRYVQGMARGSEYTQALVMVLPKLAANDPNRAVELAVAMAKTREEQVVYSSVFDLVVRKDIEQAKALLNLVPAGEGRENALRAMMVGWADQNVVEALAWAKGIGDLQERSTAIEATLIVRSQRDARRTIDLAQELLTGEALDRTLTEAMRHLTDEDPKVASETVTRLPDGPAKARATLEVVRALAGQDPPAALAWIKSLPETKQQIALHNVLDFWSANDSAAAGAYVAAMPKGEGQDKAVAHLAENLAGRNPAGALQWANKLQGSARTAAFVRLASGWAKTDPAAAAHWAASLPADDPARAAAIKDAISYWMLRDPDAARQFSNALSTADKTTDY